MSRQNDGFEFKFSLLQKVLSAFFRVINVFVPWDRLGYLIGAVNIATLRDRLRRDNLHHAGYGVQAATPWVPGNERWRSADGSYNSLDHPRMGMACSRFGRNILVGHVDHLHAAVLGGERILRVLQLLLAEAHGNKLLRVDVEILDQKAGNRLSPLIRQNEVIGIGALGVGVTGDEEHRAFELFIAAAPSFFRIGRA